MSNVRRTISRWIAATAVLVALQGHAEDGVTKDRILIGQAAGFTGSVAGAVKEQAAGALAYIDSVNRSEEHTSELQSH